jgi:hypothetical protein
MSLNLREKKYCNKVEEITASDLASSLYNIAVPIYVGASGDIRAILASVSDSDAISGTALASGVATLFKNAQQGSCLGGDIPILVKAVFSTDTTATHLLKLLEDR